MKNRANVHVKVDDRGFHYALSTFTKKCGKEGIINEQKRKSYFVSPSQAERNNKLKAKRKQQRSVERRKTKTNSKQN